MCDCTDHRSHSNEPGPDLKLTVREKKKKEKKKKEVSKATVRLHKIRTEN